MTDTVHIASLVVQCQPAQLAAVCSRIEGHADAEVHATDPNGKIVVLLETGSEGGIADLSDRFGRLDGVLSCNLVFHGIDSDADMPLKESMA